MRHPQSWRSLLQSGGLLLLLLGLLPNSASATATNNTAAAHAVHEHDTGYYALIWPFVSLVIGVLLNGFVHRVVPSFPFTVALLIVGFFIGLLHRGTDKGLGILSDSIDSWDNIDPHMLMYTLLPALLFGDSMSLNFHTVKKCFVQCLLLAGPGVVIGAGLMGIVAKYLVPDDWHWNWKMALCFGSITAATDPVAVVGLLKDMGASKRLTMVIAGESLMNDGVAIVAFTLFLNMLGGTTYDAAAVTEFLTQVALGGVAVGLGFGLVGLAALLCLRNPAEDNHANLCNQTTVTFTLAYLSFFVAEHTCHVSGVLSCVTCGVTIAAAGWPLMDARLGVQHVWHVVEFMGNIIVFMLTGLIIASDIYEEFKQDSGRAWEYLGYIPVIWFFMQLIRLTVVVVLYWPLCNTGYGLERGARDAFIMVWGGLRGAVGLVLCMIVDRDNRIPNEGPPFVLLIGGATTLTLLVNGTTCGFFLKKLGMLTEPLSRELLFLEAEQYVHLKTEGYFDELTRPGKHFEYSKANKKEAEKMISILGTSYDTEERKLRKKEFRERVNVPYDSVLRDVLLEMIKSNYWIQIEQHAVPVSTLVPADLISSVDIALDQTHESLGDWAALESVLESRVWYQCLIDRSQIVRSFMSLFGILPDRERNIFLLGAFLRAHDHGFRRLSKLMSGVTSTDWNSPIPTQSMSMAGGTPKPTAMPPNAGTKCGKVTLDPLISSPSTDLLTEMNPIEVPFSTKVHPFSLPTVDNNNGTGAGAGTGTGTGTGTGVLEADHTDDVLDCDDIEQETNTMWADNEETKREPAEIQGRKAAYIPTPTGDQPTAPLDPIPLFGPEAQCGVGCAGRCAKPSDAGNVPPGVLAAYEAFERLAIENEASVVKANMWLSRLCPERTTGYEALATRWLVSATLTKQHALLAKYKKKSMISAKGYEELEEQICDDFHMLLDPDLSDTQSQLVKKKWAKEFNVVRGAMALQHCSHANHS